MHDSTHNNNSARIGLRALVVEDLPDVAMGLEYLLQGLGNTVRVAFDAQEALYQGADFKPDVIFLDIGLPDLSGYEVCKEIRYSDWGCRSFIVALTGRDGPEDLIRAAHIGFDRHVVKPMALATLQEILHHVNKGFSNAAPAPDKGPWPFA